MFSFVQSPMTPEPACVGLRQIKSVMQHLPVGLAVLGVSLMGFIADAEAFQVKLSPEIPKLGEAISVTVETTDKDGTPTVSSAKRTYPVFLIEENKYRAFIPTTPLDKPGSMSIDIKVDEKTEKVTVPLKERNFPVQKITIKKTSSLSATKTELERVREFKKIVTPKKLWNGKFIPPNSGKVSSVFGVLRYYNGVFAKDYYHTGVDYAGGYGSAVVAPAAGRVVLVGLESKGFRVHGNTVGIDHGQGVLSIFLHLSSINVKEGQMVSPGDKIGKIGSTGASTGPHLHWGLYVNGVAVDPVPWRFEVIE